MTHAVKVWKSLLILLLFINFCSCLLPNKTQPLQPIRARNIGKNVPEPSGLTYCSSTKNFYSICDKKECHYIYEIDSDGNLLRKFDIPVSVDDIEAVACDDVNGLIFIAEEGKHKITAFNFPQATNETIVTLTVNNSFIIDTHLDDPQSGIEGLTVDPINNVLYAANEKNDQILFKLNLTGEVLMISYPEFSEDLSGLCYDPTFDHLWVVSDRSERVYITSPDGRKVIDYWDLPFENAEGVAVDNDNDPPLLLIVTDPSQDTGAQYVPALFVFEKPSIGQGLKYYDANNPPPYPPVVCDGCDEVYGDIEKLSNAYNRYQAEMFWSELIITLLLVGSLLVGVALIARSTYKKYQKSVRSAPKYTADL